MKSLLLAALLLFPVFVFATDNCSNLPAPAVLTDDGLARTPVMGWNSWYPFYTSPTEAELKNQADLLVSTGLAAAGYKLVSLDDGWAAGRTGSTIFPNAVNFPDGMAATFTYIHGDGLTAGIYSSPNTTTCGGFMGSGTFESADAATFAAWGADFLKYDGCSVDALYASCYTTSGPQIYQYMAQFIRATGRPMVLMDGFQPAPWTPPAAWAKSAGYNQWRMQLIPDIGGVWANFDAEIDRAAVFAGSQQVGNWADPDMLFGQTENSHFGTFTTTQSQTQFGLAALWSSPLLLGMDISTLAAGQITMYKNPEVIAVDQDPAGRMAVRYSQAICGSATCEVWVKPLHDGTWAMGLLNRDSASQTISVSFASFGVNPDVRDLWAQSDLGTMTSYSTMVAGDGLALLKVIPPARTNPVTSEMVAQ